MTYETKRKALREKALNKLRKFPKVNGPTLLDRLSDLPTESPVGNLRDKARKALHSGSKDIPWRIRDSFRDLEEKEIVFAYHLQKAGLPYRDIEPILRIKGMNGMNSYRAIHTSRGQRVIREFRKSSRVAA